MAFTPQGRRGAAGGGLHTPAGGNQARGKTTAGTNAGSFKAVSHGEASIELGPTAQVPPSGTSFGGNFVPRGMTAQEAYPEAFGVQPAMADRDIRAALVGDGTTLKGYRLPPADKALVDNDLAAIMVDPTLTAEHKAKFQDMAEQLDRFGTVHTALNGPLAVRFGRGSQYGGDNVPSEFASFYAKAEADARARAQRSSESVKPAVAAAAQAFRDGAIAPERVSVFRRFLGH